MMLTRLSDHDVLFVMAARAEFGPHLRARITPLITGVGPVEAAIGTATALARLSAAGTPPDLVVSLGSAGSARLAHCGLYQASAVAWRDIDASPLGFEKGLVPFLDLPKVLPLPLRLPGIEEATLSTGGNIVTGLAYDGIAEDMVDMETYAVQRACMQAGLPLIALRGISDGQSDLTGLHDWTDYLHIIDEKLAGAVDILSTALAEGLLRS
ncbi:5'-methylthioadenosine/S-adenosylhomocysteine nucleosidase [Pararhodobacter aggregans]|uniref:5'-methylthioadenosine/S-adenosylhomocysteine nucleosidase n=1 Tax=Pararhodobacter aggregans TaxID=404875 RepID=A0A2T7UPP6_9RHOB|nr:5'-methylthioadenosine/S-adenosylhomocysteine nucleosidase [Pararhodobacter aggregans]PTX01247.1 adenosylhomocysteine nucleosidase [Pararhodobacter aggregans]PVE46626.1 5'-methylthioadenosine/S-adenosylhomocysteine nucleosidase [Pararhodobacter aggregans]